MDSTALRTLRRQHPIATISLSLIVAGVLAVLLLGFLSFAFDRVPVYTRNITGHVQNLLPGAQARQEQELQKLSDDARASYRQMIQAQHKQELSDAQALHEKMTQALQEQLTQTQQEQIAKAEQERSLYCFRTMNATKAATLKELYECTHAKQHP